MPKIVTINGIGLHEVRMLLEGYNNGAVSYLSYPPDQIRIGRKGERLCLVIPAYLAVELYRTGTLPQDVNLPVEVSVGGGAKAWYLVSDLRYPNSYGAFETVTFTLTRVPQVNANDEHDTVGRSHSRAPDTGAYITDITHYLDDGGNLAKMPGPARKLASFLTLLIEATTATPSTQFQDSRIRCRTKACTANILTRLPPGQDEIAWHCPECGHHGVITNWQATKWSQLKPTEQPD